VRNQLTLGAIDRSVTVYVLANLQQSSRSVWQFRMASSDQMHSNKSHALLHHLQRLLQVGKNAEALLGP